MGMPAANDDVAAARPDLLARCRELPADDDPVARAEAAMQLLSVQFDGWIADAAERLAKAWSEAVRAEPMMTVAREALYQAAHDLKGEAATLGFPVAGRIAGSLCALLDAFPADRVPTLLAGQHVASVRAIVRERVRGDTDPVAAELARRLGRLTAEAVQAASTASA